MSDHRDSVIAIAIGVLFGLTIVAIFFDTPFSMTVRENAMALAERSSGFFNIGNVALIGETVRSWGLWGAALVTLVYALGSMIAFPASLMTLVSVLAFGYGAIFVTGIGAFIGLAASFFVARRLFQHHIGWLCSRYPVTRGIENAIERNGFWIVFLMRQSPIVPFAAQNYMFGMLQTRARDYLLGSGLGIIPGTIAKVYVFEQARNVVSGGLSPVQLALIAVGLSATIAVMTLVGRYVRRELKAQTT